MKRSSELYCIPSASIRASSSSTDPKSLMFGEVPGKQTSPLLTFPRLYKVRYLQLESLKEWRQGNIYKLKKAE